jgi:LmbE family N-acetylglucosaminyl deacetylase
LLLSDELESVLVITPHADDEVVGCGGLLARLAARPTRVHVLYVAVDGFHHYGLPEDTTYAERVAEVESVVAFYRCTYEIVYGDKDLIEKLDTIPKRDLVDRFEAALNEHRPELLLIPSGTDYDQDHVAVFTTAFAAARPIGPAFGKHLVPHVLTYEAPKLNWAAEPLPQSVAYCDITEHLEAKLDGLRRYRTQLRPKPHIRSAESLTALATLRGAEVGVNHAEAFGVLRTLI